MIGRTKYGIIRNMKKIKYVERGFFGNVFEFEYPGGYVFTNNPECDDYDWLLAFEDMSKERPESLKCPRECTILATWEPVSIKDYGKVFTRQFGHLLTNRPREAENHPHYHFGQGYFLWGIIRSYEEACKMKMPPKDKLLSIICSNKQMRHTQHHERFELIKHLAAAIPGAEWYGKGVKPILYKQDALDTFKYHVAIENHIAPGHWSEKIIDPILCECLTFYAGDPELGKVLPERSFIPIPIGDPKECERIIKAAIEGGEYEKRLDDIREAKRLLLTKYNLWAQTAKIIEEAEADKNFKPQFREGVTIYSRHGLRKHNPLAALEDGYLHLKRLIKTGA